MEFAATEAKMTNIKEQSEGICPSCEAQLELGEGIVEGDTFKDLAVVYPQASPAFTINDADQCSKWNHFVLTNNMLEKSNMKNYYSMNFCYRSNLRVFRFEFVYQN